MDKPRMVHEYGLTQVWDDRAFHRLLEVEIRRSERHLRPLSMLMVGLDDLKADTETSGHLAGHGELKEIASLLRKSVRSCDIVAMYGRNDLAIVLVEANKMDATDTASRLRHLVEDGGLEHDDTSSHRTSIISIGVASYPTDATESVGLVSKASQALYEAKGLGGNLVRAAEPELSLMRTYHDRRLYFLSKRCMDLIASLLLVVVTFPLFLLIALAIKMDSPGPVLFRQPRVGLRKRVVDGEEVWELSTFTMHKFRTMCHERGRGMHWQFMKALIQEDEEEVARIRNSSDRAVKKLTEDPRITRVGRVLRKATLDEVPQLWNVLKGEMSLVGPRPPIPYETAEYEPRYWRRLEAIPGCTGLWQVSGWNKLGYKEQVELDIWYIKHQSLWLDMKILLQTVPAVLRRMGGG
jgi:diguanylate cyclase (GGDEF)-like protein